MWTLATHGVGPFIQESLNNAKVPTSSRKTTVPRRRCLVPGQGSPSFLQTSVAKTRASTGMSQCGPGEKAASWVLGQKTGQGFFALGSALGPWRWRGGKKACLGWEQTFLANKIDLKLKAQYHKSHLQKPVFSASSYASNQKLNEDVRKPLLFTCLPS